MSKLFVILVSVFAFLNVASAATNVKDAKAAVVKEDAKECEMKEGEMKDAEMKDAEMKEGEMKDAEMKKDAAK